MPIGNIHFRTLVAAGALIAAPLLASAATITVNYANGSAFGSNGNIVANIDGPGPAQTVGVGGLDLEQTGVLVGPDPLLGEFVGWCVDIANTLALASNYDVPTAPSYIDLTRQKNIERLFETAFSTLDLSSNAESAGFQMAIWELVYETGSSFDLAVGDFLVNTAGAARTFGQSLLDNINGVRDTDYGLVFLNANPTGGSQNLVTATKGGGVLPPIPVPAAGWLMLAGLGGLAAARRRKKAA